ncbi:MAG: sulfatase-like hydrolase/transferase, partial [Acidobacteria bacterium]|nr:sulfatase-like hydrolase/transferase [Acidobacteriota bacterium]
MFRVALQALLLALAAHPGALRAQQPPNFVFLLGEGQGWNSLSVAMDPDVPGSKSATFRTPNFERLAAAGMRFANFYAPSPRCTPSRATYFTGKTPALLRMTFVSAWTPDNPRLSTPAPVLEMPVEETTIAELLRAQGYATAHFGKWHVGRRLTPRDHGFDESDGPTNNGGPDNVAHPNPAQAYGIA